ncbi:MAG TPA: site-2 protease family protein [Paucimonas sp.]|nr:site-2 protease family protein [Paucimonas sp.]
MESIALPPLREELSLHPGPALATGEPNHVLEDPVRNQFFRIDWMTFEILRRWSFGNADDILLSIRAATALDPSADDVAAVARFLNDNQLLRPDPLAAIKPMAQRYLAARGKWHQRLLHHYLFFRIPLLKPDRWLTRVAPAFEWAYSAAFARLTLLALLVGGAQVARDWQRFSATLADAFTPGGLLAYALALIGVKCIHELGHALTAKRYGCRVPTMGIAFLVLWPVPYTDTNDAWRLGSNRQRQRIAAAGVAAELIVAAWSTLAWALLPDGLLRAMVFPLATTTWIATLAVNTSPFMRFDGYFLLSDWLDMPNLHARAFALARWDLRERLFGLGAPPPEYLPRRRNIGLILFAWATWLYRLTLFIGIAVLVYHFFIKIVGIFLFAVEIAWFVLRPIAQEIAAWRALLPQLKSSRRARRSALLFAALLLLFVLPWPARIQSSAMLHARQVFPIHAPREAQLLALPIAEGGAVAAGQAVMQLSSPETDSRRRALEALIERLRWQASSGAAFDAEQRGRGAVLREELATAEAALQELEQEAVRYRPVAPFSGRLRDVLPELAPGVWVAANERLAILVGDDGLEAESYLEEDLVHRIAVGDTARFYPDGLDGPAVRLVVTSIDQDASRILPSGLWAAAHGGAIAAREKQGAWYPEHAVYRVGFALWDEQDARDLAPAASGQSRRGTVVIAGAWEAPGARFVRHFLSVLWREIGF